MKSNFLRDFTPQLLISMRTYTKEKFVKDLMAGIIVGIVALPLAVAFGIASGVSPQTGIYTAIIGGFIVSFLGGSTVQIGGPTGAFIVIVYNTIQNFGLDGLIITTIMAGIMLVLMGVLKLGVVIKFIPYPIIVGYMSGIAVIIFSTQMKDFFGLSINTSIPPDFIGKWKLYANNIGTTDLLTLAMGILSILIIIFSKKISSKVPGSLLAVVSITLIAYIIRHYFGIDSISTIGDQFNLSGNLPDTSTSFSFDVEKINALFPTAFTLAMICSIESLISAGIAEGVTGDRCNSNMELVAQGVANIVVPLFGGIPVTGALARTMTNVNNGGRTPIAGIVHAIFLAMTVFFLGNLTKLIPMVCLAGILIVVSYNMSEWRNFRAILRGSKADAAVLVTTFLLTVIFDLTIAIEIGLILAVFLFMKRIMETTQVSVIKDKMEMKNNSEFLSDSNNQLEIPKAVEIYEIDGPFFFGIANKFDESMRIIGEKSKIRIIRMRKVPFIDSTAIHNLETLCLKSKNEGIYIILSGLRPQVKATLHKAGFDKLIGEENMCDNIDIALKRANEILGIEV